MSTDSTNLEEQLQFLASRPSRSGKQQRVVRALDEAVPEWNSFITGSEFKKWLLRRNPVNNTCLATAFEAIWDRRDGQHLAILLRWFVDSQSGRRPPAGALLSKGGYRSGEMVADHFEMIDVLGAGGFGEVFLVLLHEHQLFEFGALKILRPNWLPDAGTRARFEKEAHILTSLRLHPHLVAPQYIEKIEDSWAIVSEFVLPDQSGKLTLADHINSGNLTEKFCAKIMTEVCAGLASAYKDGVMAHRDLKPSNVLIDLHGFARVMDFGLASTRGDRGDIEKPHIPSKTQEMSNLTQAGTAFGTPAYMAPEQFFNAENCDERSDIYSLGVIFYEMTAGRLPFKPQINNMESWAELHCKSKVPRLESRFWQIIERCLNKNPESRYLGVDELAHDIRLCCEKYGLQTPSAQEFKNEGMALHNDLVQRAIALSRLGQHEQAIPLYREALGILDLISDVWCRLAFSYNALGRWDDALEAFSHSTPSQRDSGNDFNYGYSYYHRSTSREDRTLALKQYRESVRKNPELLEGWSMIARCEMDLGHPVEALDALAQCSNLPNAGVEVWLQKFDLEQRLGRHSDAQKSRQVLLKKWDSLNLTGKSTFQEIDFRIKTQALVNAFLVILGAGFTQSKVMALVEALVEAQKTGKLNTHTAPEIIRRINPAVLHSQSLKMLELIQAHSIN
jgi:serine/threonine protein kinase